jgi:hypothetical protein
MSEETMDLMKNMIHIWFLHMTVEKKKKMLKLQDIRYCCSEIAKRGTANKSDVYKAYKRSQNCFWMLDFCSWAIRKVIWSKLGMPALEAIQSATTTNAMLLGMEQELDR